MSKSRFVLDKFAKVIEQGLLSYKDLTDEIMNILKSKRDEIVISACYERNIPVQCSMGGGYAPDVNVIVEAHANTYRVAEDIHG